MTYTGSKNPYKIGNTYTIAIRKQELFTGRLIDIYDNELVLIVRENQIIINRLNIDYSILKKE